MSSSELVKWIEIWLDRAGERAYQPAFLSALTFHKYKIVHNTSHNSLELGKDVIARAPNGDLIAFQLKGNPGTRLTMGQWHEIYPQVIQLVTMPLAALLSGKKTAHHRPILVTNGEVEEDVQSAISAFNSTFVPQYASALPLELWTRGTLIRLLADAAAAVWPANLSTQIELLRAAASGGKESISARIITAVATGALGWTDDRPSTARSIERVAGLGTIGSILSGQHAQVGNLFEVIKTKAIILGIVAGFFYKHSFNTKKHSYLYDLLRHELFTTLATYAEQISIKFRDQPFVNEGIFAEFGIQHARKMMVLALLAVHALEKHGENVSSNIRDMLLQRIDFPFLDGEGIVPAFLVVFWVKEQLQAGYQNDQELKSVLYTIITGAIKGELISSYYDLNEVILARYKEYLGRQWHPVDLDQRNRMSQFAHGLTLLLVRRNWKQTVRQFWPDVTRILTQHAELQDPSEFAFFRSEKSIEFTKAAEIPETWTDLIEKASRAIQPNLPPLLAQDPTLVSLLTVFLPYRCTQDLLLWLDRQFTKTWY